MDNTPTDCQCFPIRSRNHTNGKTRNVCWFSRLLHPLNRTTKINVISSVQEHQVSNEGQITMSREEYDRVLQERVDSLINDRLRRKDDEIIALKNQVLRLTEDLDRLRSTTSNIENIIRNLSRTGDKEGASSSNSKEQQPYFGTGFWNGIRRYQNKKKGDKNGIVIKETDITGALPTPPTSNPSSSADGYVPSNFGRWEHDGVLQEINTLYAR